MRKREQEQERVAQMLGAPPADAADPLAPPSLIDRGPLCAAAVAVWKDLAPKLARTHRLQPQHRPLFAMFCVYFAEWVLANEDVLANGLVQNVATVAGGMMERTRPMVLIRDRAFEMVLKLSDRFGLTPSDEYALFKDQAMAAAHNPGLFDRPGGESSRGDAGAAEPAAAAGPADGGSLIGSLKRMDSEPPQRLN